MYSSVVVRVFILLCSQSLLHITKLKLYTCQTPPSLSNDSSPTLSMSWMTPDSSHKCSHAAFVSL